MHKKFEINRTIGFLLNNFLSVGLFRFGWEKFACFFCAQLFQTEENGPIDLIFFYSIRLEMKMMQIYFDGAVVPLSNKFKFLKTKVEVGKLKK